MGIVGDVSHSQLTVAPDPEFYVPVAQAPPSMMMLAVRSDGRPESLTAAVRAAINAVDDVAAGVSRQDDGAPGR